MAASVHEISNLIDPVGVAARSEASQLGHKVKTLLLTQLGGLQWVHTETTAIVVFSFEWQVSQMASYFEPLIMAAIGTASKIVSSQQQMAVLDQTKTLTESALQMLYTAKEAGGNPKVVNLATDVHSDLRWNQDDMYKSVLCLELTFRYYIWEFSI